MAERHVGYVRLDEVEPATRNAKLHSGADIKRSLDHFGVAELPLIDERTGRLVAGHGRLDQLKALHEDGRRVPDGVTVDEDGMWKMPVIRGWASRSDEDAEAYLVASNHLTIKGGWDEHDLAEMLGDLQQADVLTLTGFDNGDLEALIALYAPGGGAGMGLPGSDQDTLDDTDRAGWPIIRAQVPPEVYERFQAIDGDNDAQKVRVLLDRAGVA